MRMSLIKALITPVTPFQQNAPILYCEDILLGSAKDNNLIPEKIFLTHGHADHAGAAMELSSMLSIEIEGPHKEDAFLLDSLESQGKMFGFQAQNCIPNRWLEDGDEVKLGGETLQVIFCPGHTPGHIIFFHAPSNLAAVGDVIFQGSIGRTDLPRGNHQDLINSITQKLWPLGEEVLFISGHGPVSTFGQERKNNAFVSDAVLSI